MRKKLNATQIKELLLPIPADDFITEKFSNETGKCCFLGHLQRLTSDDPSDYSFYNCNDKLAYNKGDETGARDLTKDFLTKIHGIYCDGSSVNNQTDVNGYNEPIIKDRLMHMVNDMIKAGY